MVAEWAECLNSDGLPSKCRAMVANFAVRSDPGCIEAHAFLAARAKNPDLARLRPAEAMMTGEAL